MRDSNENIISKCDIIVWYMIDDLNMNSKYIRANTNATRAKETDLGIKYNIVLFKENIDTTESADIFSAIIGDTVGYVDRLCSIGYSGLIFREKALKMVEARRTIVDLLDMFGFNQRDIKKVLKSSV